jgi:hypothetical protein
MEGAAERRKSDIDLAMFTAWHTAVFALSGYRGKLKGKSLSDFLQDGKPNQHSLQRARMHAFFQKLKMQGLPVEISRTEIN